MNILQVHNYYQIPGGEDTVVENERRMLEHHGHRVICYTRDNKEFSEAGGLQKLWMYAESFFSLRTYREVRRILQKEKIDIVHVHNTVHLISPSVFYAAIKEGVPVVQTLHNFRIQCPAAVFYRNGHICEDCIKKGMGCAVRHKCYRNSRIQTAAVAFSEWVQRISGIRGKIRYICLTEFNKEKLLQINRNSRVIIPPENVFVKPNFTPDTGSEYTEKGVSKEDAEQYYISIGRLERIKGTHLIVKAFAHTGLPLIMVGSGELEDKVRKYLKKHRINNIRLTGQLPHEEAMSLLKKAKALVIMPQCYETFGMNVIEAYSKGVPVVTNDIGNAASLVEEGITGLRCHNTVEDLESALIRIEGSDYKSHLESRIKNKYKNYTEDKSYSELIEIFNNISRINGENDLSV